MIRGLEKKSEIMDNCLKEQHKHGHTCSSLSVEKSGFTVGKFAFLELALMV